MPRTIAYRLLALVAIGIAFTAGAVVSAIRGWGSPIIYVDVVNNSGMEIRSVILEYESCGSKNQLISNSLTANAHNQFRFIACGEAGYQIRVKFVDGSDLIGGSSYAEGAYRITEIVERKSIQSTVNLYSL